MKLTLSTDEGLVLAHWDIEEEFGDLTHSLPRQLLMLAILDEIRKHKECKECG